MVRILFAAGLILISASALASREQCDRLYPEGNARLECYGTYGVRHSWTDDELRTEIDGRVQRKADEERKEIELKARRETARTKLAEESKKKALRLKGLYPGMTLAAADVFHPNLAEICTETGEPQKDFECFISPNSRAGNKYQFEALESLADSRVSLWTLRGTKGVIWQISALIDSDAALELQLALAIKYPYATLSEPVVQNRMGAKFGNQTATWRSGDLVLKVERYGSSLDNGYVHFTSTKAPRLARKVTKDL